MSTEKPITAETAIELGLLPEEFEKINQLLGRTPNFNELTIYSKMWSEECSNKNSIYWLKSLPKEGPHLLAKTGEENEGFVNIGDGLACVLKINKANDSDQSTALRSSGINRELIAKGAQPIAQINGIQLGDFKLEKTKTLANDLVNDFIENENTFRVPLAINEFFFDEGYNDNPILNSLSAGIVKTEETVSAIAYGVGNPVYFVGFSDNKDEQTFQDQLLAEATIDLFKTRAVIGINAVGAAGITYAASEMVVKGEHGMDIWLDRIPTSKENLKAWEVLSSETQPGLLIVIQKGREKEAENVFSNLELNNQIIGVVTTTKRLQYFVLDDMVADVPADSLVKGNGAPIYKRELKEPTYFSENKKFKIESIKEPIDLKAIATQLISQPSIISKKWKQLPAESTIENKELSKSEPTDASIINIKGTNKAIALKVGFNSRYVNADPEVGGAIAVSEAARAIVCSGAEPAAINNCLNFGSLYNPEIYWQFAGSIKGISKACIKFATPVTGNSIHFNDQISSAATILPTPTIGMLGIVKDKRTRMSMDFKNEGDSIYLIGSSKNDISSSEYLSFFHKIKKSPAPAFDLDEEYDVQQAVKEVIKAKVIQSAHSCTLGGLFITLLESALPNELGFTILCDEEVRTDAFLFGEAQSRVVVSVKKEDEDKFIEIMMQAGVDFSYLGDVKGKEMLIDEESFGSIAAAKQIIDSALK